ncbi:restriction endonuclease, SacI family [Halomonas garicola]|uniref:restriction endonuclease, SacI family n=1 Tax=Halomonas garicola TaxID=1690008 RepID=UPI0028A28244|nr:restriction endonuclease, SacI family [Halomonas garicola]
MNVTIDKNLAESILREVIHEVKNSNWQPSGRRSEKIKSVILGTHKTYRYILTNAILAKVANPTCNPLSLQSGAKLNGAFDARSLCHNVIVPIERELLAGRLGESNEPFLNKPARFTELSEENSVRKGRDTFILSQSIAIIQSLRNNREASLALKECIYWILQRQPRELISSVKHKEGHFYPASLAIFSQNLTQQSFEGETAAILAGITFNILGDVSKRSLNVITHKVNQSGASSREVSDIDVFENENLVFSAEVKDKEFNFSDVQHAVNKISRTNLDTLIFLKGPNGKLIKDTEESIIHYWLNKGINLHFINVNDFFSSIVAATNGIERHMIIQWAHSHISSAKVKDETFNHIVRCINDL